MINRCKYCGSVCPDFSDMCDLCCLLESEEETEIEYNDNLELANEDM